MKRKLFFIIALACCLVLAVGILAACNDSSQQTGGNDPSAQPGDDAVYRIVTFDLNGGDGEIDPRDYAVGYLMDLPEPTRSGYRFIGWQDAFGEKFDSTSIMPNEDLTLYAQWEIIVSSYEDEYVYFKPATQGVKDPDTKDEYEGMTEYVYVELTSDDLGGREHVGEDNNFDFVSGVSMEYSVKDGYTLQWWRDYDCSIANGAQRFTLNYGSNFQFLTVNTNQQTVATYLVDFYVLHDYAVNLYSNIYAEEPYDTVYVVENRTFASDTEVYQLEGFEFDKRVYWNTNVGWGQWTAFNYSTRITRDWNLYQTYKPKTITADLDGGTLDAELIVTPYTEDQQLPVPAKEGYDFIGWQLPGADNNKEDYFADIEGESTGLYLGAERNNLDGINFSVLKAVWNTRKYIVEYGEDEVIVRPATIEVIYIDDTHETINSIVYETAEKLYNLGDTVIIEVEDKYDSAWLGWYEGDNKVSAGDQKQCSIVIEDIQKHYTAKWEVFAGLEQFNYTADSSGITINGVKDTSITELTIPSCVTSIDSGCLNECSSLSSISVESGNPTYASRNGILYNSRITQIVYVPQKLSGDVVLADGIRSIPRQAFYSRDEITSVNIPDSVTSIGMSAFYNCDNLQTVTLGVAVTEIKNGAFEACSNLSLINWNATAVEDFESDGIVHSRDVFTDTGENGFELVFGDNVERIPGYLFDTSSNKGVSTVRLGNSVASIGARAFYNCNNLSAVHIDDISKWCGIYFPDEYSNPLYYAQRLYSNGDLIAELIIPNGVSRIRDYAFINMKELQCVVMGDEVTSIGKMAFSGCSGLNTVSLGNGVTEVLANAFLQCSNLQAVYINDIGAWCKVDFAGDTANPTYYAHELYLNNELIEDLIIPAEVNTINDYVFVGCTSINTVSFTDNLSLVGTAAFKDTAWLNNLPDGPIYIGRTLYAYKGEMPANTEFIVRDGTIKISGDVFSDCINLVSITIPDSVTSIEEDAFAGCSGLNAVNITDLSAWCRISFAHSTSNPVNYAQNIYLNGELVETVSFTGISSVKPYTFVGCTSLKSVDLSGVSRIGTYAFAWCDGLKSVTIPSSVQYIESRAFNGCAELTTVVFQNTAWRYLYKTYDDGSRDWKYFSGLSNSSTAATYLTSTYAYTDWMY